MRTWSELGGRDVCSLSALRLLNFAKKVFSLIYFLHNLDYILRNTYSMFLDYNELESRS
jgi:hypothetical protein